jgi:hypothetical protein
MRVEVEHRPGGPGGEPVPTAIGFGPRAVGVVEVLDRWPGEDHTYVKVAGEDGGTYILRHDLVENAWRLVLFRRAEAAGPA